MALRRFIRMDMVPADWHPAVAALQQDDQEIQSMPLVCMDIFAGQGNLSAAFVHAGLPALGFEKKNHDIEEDVTTEQGVTGRLAMLLRVHPFWSGWALPVRHGSGSPDIHMEDQHHDLRAIR